MRRPDGGGGGCWGEELGLGSSGERGKQGQERQLHLSARQQGGPAAREAGGGHDDGMARAATVSLVGPVGGERREMTGGAPVRFLNLFLFLS